MSGSQSSRPTILHCCSASDVSGMQERCIRLIGALVQDAKHALVIEGPVVGAIPAGTLRPSFPDLAGPRWPARLKRLAAAMAGYDLICTWGSGALDVALAHTLFADVYKLPPLVHHEGEGDVERSTLARRIAFGRTAALVVPTKPMEQRALEKWQQPRHRVRLIPQGIDAARYAIPPKRDGVPGIIKRRGESWLGTFATPQQAAPLIKLVTELPEEWQLVVATPQGGHEAILSEASRHGVDDRVHPVTPPSDIARLVSLFDLFVSPHSDTAALEAVAAGLPAIVARDGEAAAWVASENGPFLCSPGDEKELASAISKLAGDRTLRRRIGEANRQKALAEFDEAQMIERIRALYRSLIGPR